LYTIVQATALLTKYYTRPKILAKDKHPSLFMVAASSFVISTQYTKTFTTLPTLIPSWNKLVYFLDQVYNDLQLVSPKSRRALAYYRLGSLL